MARLVREKADCMKEEKCFQARIVRRDARSKQRFGEA